MAEEKAAAESRKYQGEPFVVGRQFCIKWVTSQRDEKYQTSQSCGLLLCQNNVPCFVLTTIRCALFHRMRYCAVSPNIVLYCKCIAVVSIEIFETQIKT